MKIARSVSASTFMADEAESINGAPHTKARRNPIPTERSVSRFTLASRRRSPGTASDRPFLLSSFTSVLSINVRVSCLSIKLIQQFSSLRIKLQWMSNLCINDGILK